MVGKVQELNRENFAVRQHLKYVDLYANRDNYKALTYEDTLLVREELAPLIEPEPDEASALRFDALMYGIELACLAGKKYSRAKHDLVSKAAGIAGVANITASSWHALRGRNIRGRSTIWSPRLPESQASPTFPKSWRSRSCWIRFFTPII